MAVGLPFSFPRKSVTAITLMERPVEVGDLLESLYSGDKSMAAAAGRQLAAALSSGSGSLNGLSMEQWERLIFPVKCSDDPLMTGLFSLDLQTAILSAIARGRHQEGIICARFASYRACNRRVRKAARVCLAALEGVIEQPAGNLARAIS